MKQTHLMIDRKAYNIPNFAIREMEVMRIKNNKSRGRSDKYEKMSVSSSRRMATMKSGINRKESSGGESNGGQSVVSSIKNKKVGVPSRLGNGSVISAGPSPSPASSMKQSPPVRVVSPELPVRRELVDSNMKINLN